MIIIDILTFLVKKGVITKDEAMQVTEFPPAWQPDRNPVVNPPQWTGKYIGARYVPKIMGKWSDSIAYEPLMIVQDEIGNSFTSKSNVPVGTPLSDTKYWAPTGNYNAQIANIQNLVNLLSQGLAQEIHDRENGDSMLQNSIADEIENRQNADTDLQNEINEVSTLLNNTNRNVDTVRYHVYVSSVGSDSNSGTQESPFLTLDRALKELDRHTSLYVNFLTGGEYSYSYLNVSQCILHMYNRSNSTVTINFPTNGQMYRMHLNWSNMTLNFNNVYFDECGIYFQNCIINQLLKLQGGIAFLSQCTFKDIIEVHGIYTTIQAPTISVNNRWLTMRENSLVYITQSITINRPTATTNRTLISVEGGSRLTLGTSPSESISEYYDYLINVSGGILFSNRSTLNNYKNYCINKLINTSGFYLLLESNGFFAN